MPALYDSIISLVKKAMTSLTNILKKAESSPNSASFFDARIHDDMLPLTVQVHCATDLAQKLVHRLSGTEPEALDRNETTSFTGAYARIQKVEAILSGADATIINAADAKTVPLGLSTSNSIDIPALGYVTGYALPNLFFHIIIAYNILRKEGVPLGKDDYLSPFMADHMP
ncbi:hypothetical protein F5884DRAFT_507713 [Xylogone sp. PMI_703]|nr:hypothetical protein F5884DRAFT_507713 [Xylogone sp. PMI_703]